MRSSPETCRKGRGVASLQHLIGFVVTILVIFLYTSEIKARTITIASKSFNENYVLAEIMAQLLESKGYEVNRKFGLGGTMICFRALENGMVDLYPEYSGTMEIVILNHSHTEDFASLQRWLRTNRSYEFLAPFGFNNTYALSLREQTARKYNIHTISDLKKAQGLRYGFNYEFMERPDGWFHLAARYGLHADPISMQHSLLYNAIQSDSVDVINTYTTDGEIARYNLRLLKDDLGFFPRYLAAPLVRKEVPEDVKIVLNLLSGRINEKQMREMNSAVTLEHRSFATVAGNFLISEGLILPEATPSPARWRPAFLPSAQKWRLLEHRTLRHITLTILSILAAMCIAIPFAIMIHRLPSLAKPILYITGLMQTIPSIALLAFMIPIFGIGTKPAITALFLYALLPILRSTYAALGSIDPVLKKVSVGIGMSRWDRLRLVEIPLAMPNIFAGLRTATIINIGTATLAAFIGAGGLGEPIVTGLALNSPVLIMEGAVPAAIMALIAEFLFELLERFLIPAHLRRQTTA